VDSNTLVLLPPSANPHNCLWPQVPLFDTGIYASMPDGSIGKILRISLIPGVATVQTRVAEDVVLSVPKLVEPASARLISLPTAERSAESLNRLNLSSGRFPSPQSDDEVVASQTFARANSLALGSRSARS
jgi:hypothetical protein